jgi:transcriptional regulator with XRE-family HTH domain
MKERVSNDAAFLKALGKAIATRRKSLKMTQADLASIINMEVNRRIGNLPSCSSLREIGGVS